MYENTETSETDSQLGKSPARESATAALAEIDDILGISPTQKKALGEIDKILAEAEEKNKGYFSKVADDLGNIGKAWNSGNFYSEGGWADIAKTLVDRKVLGNDDSEKREKLYQNYKLWREKNPSVENKTIVGDVVNGVANLVPLMVDQTVEAAVPVAAAAAGGAAIGAAGGGVGAIPAGIAGAGLGYKAASALSSWKIALADVYTSLRDEGYDDETAARLAYKYSLVYAPLEYAGKAVAPVSRRVLGGKQVGDLAGKVVGGKIENAAARGIAKAAVDTAITGTGESLIEGAQDSVLEAAKQDAKGGGYDAAEIAKAGVRGFESAAPAMYGMAMLGIVPDRIAARAAQKAEQFKADKQGLEASEKGYRDSLSAAADVRAQAQQQTEQAGASDAIGGNVRYDDEGNLVGVDAPKPPSEAQKAQMEAEFKGAVKLDQDGNVLEQAPQGEVMSEAARQSDEPLTVRIDRAQDKMIELFNGSEEKKLSPEDFARLDAARKEYLELSGEDTPEKIARADGMRKRVHEWLDGILGDIQPPFVDAETILPPLLDAIEKQRDLNNAMSVEGLGNIDFKWGSVGKFSQKRNKFLDGWGIAHVIQRREEEGLDGKAFVARIPYILNAGEITKETTTPGNEKVNITLGDSTVVLRKADSGNSWIITAFRGKDAKGSGSEHNGYVRRNPDFSFDEGAFPYESQSENVSDNQANNLNAYVKPQKKADAPGGTVSPDAVREAARISLEKIGSAVAAVKSSAAASDREKGRMRRNVLRRISGNRPLPKGVVLDKKTGKLKGVVSMAEVRRYLAGSLDVGARAGLDAAKHKNWLGLYNNMLEIIRLRGGHINDMTVVAHEVGHHLERLMFDYKIDAADTPLKRELEGFCLETFGEGYPPQLRAREGWAEFVSAWLNDPEYAKRQCPIAFEAMRALELQFPKVAKVLENSRQMIENFNQADASQRVQSNIKFPEDVKVDSGLPVMQWLRRAYDNAQYWGADRLYGLEKAQKYVNDVNGWTDEKGEDFYLRARVLKGVAAENSKWTLEEKQLDLQGNELGESLADICAEKNTGCSREEFDAYLVARRAVEYFRQHPDVSRDLCRAKFGSDYETCSAVVGAADAKVKRQAEKLYKFNKNALKMLLDGGVIDDGAFERLAKVAAYVPLRRIVEELDNAGGKISGGLKNPLKGFKGSDREIISPIAQVAENEKYFREMAMRNLLFKKIVSALERTQRGGEFLSPYAESVQKVNVKYHDMAETLANSEFAHEIAAMDGLVQPSKTELVKWLENWLRSDENFMPVIWKRMAMADDAKSVLTYFENGKAKAFQVHDRVLFRAMQVMNESQAQLFSGLVGQIFKFGDWIASKTASVQRAGAVLSPNFSVGNPVRDLTAGFAYSRHSNPLEFFVYWLWYGLGSVAGAHKDLVADWRRSGGSFGSFYGNPDGKSYGRAFADSLGSAKRPVPERLKIAAKNELQNWREKPLGNLAVLPLRPIRGALWGLSKLGGLTEQAARVAEFRLAKKDYVKGEVKRLRRDENFSRAGDLRLRELAEQSWRKDSKARTRAAVDSRDITLDFESGGMASKFFNRYIPFFNATVLGSRKFWTELIPVDIGAGLDFLESVDWRTLEYDASLLENFAEKSKQQAKRSAVVAAKLAAVYSVAAVLQARSLGDEEDDLSDWERDRYFFFKIGGEIYRVPISPDLALAFGAVKNAWKAAEGKPAQSNLLADLWDMIPSFLPPVEKALLEWTSGYSFFRKRPIESAGMQNRLPSDRISAQTSASSIALARWLSDVFAMEVSPQQLDNAVQNLWAGSGRLFLSAVTDPVARRIEKIPEKPDFGAFSYPGLSAFKRNPVSPSKYVAKFAETARAAEQYVATAKNSARGKMPGRELDGENLKKADWYAARIHAIRRLNTQLGDYNNLAAAVVYSDDPPAAKSEQLRKIAAAKNALAKRCFRDFNYEANHD